MWHTVWVPWGGIALIICAVALLRYVQARAKNGGLSEQRSRELENRLAEVERRLSDIQEIVLAIDEKLERQQLTSAITQQPNSSPG